MNRKKKNVVPDIVEVDPKALDSLISELVDLDKEIKTKIEELRGIMVHGGNSSEYVR